MNEELARLESLSRELEIEGKDLKVLSSAVQEYCLQFIEELPNELTFKNAGYENSIEDEFLAPVHEGTQIEEILNYCEQRVDSGGINPASGGHLGYIPGGGLVSAALGDLIAATTNRYASVFFASPGACRLEDSLVQWAGKLMGYKKGFGGFLSSGGSMANMSAIHTAREHHQINSQNIKKAVIYLSQQSHHSILKAIKICGLSECEIRLIRLRDNFTMCLEHLKECIEQDRSKGLLPFLMVANAGSTDLGAVDDLSAISTIAKANNIWLHVDAAYGGFFKLTETGSEKLKGIEQADSIILDPHKGLFLPFGTGICLVKEQSALLKAHQYRANYMQDVFDSDSIVSSADLSPELSKHFRGLRMWLPLKLHGLNKFKAALNEKLALAQYLEKELLQLGYHIFCTSNLSVVAFQLKPGKENNELNLAVMDYIKNDGRLFISSTSLNEQVVLRAAILSFRTHQKEIDLLLSLLKSFKQTIA